jgi:DNA modification methylase
MANKRPVKTNEAGTQATPAQVKVQPAKGRPMLQWVGKRPLTRVPAYPAQHIETFTRPSADSPTWSDWPSEYAQGGLLIHGDNKEVLSHLIANGFRGRVALIYIDPPFDSGADYVRKVALRGGKEGKVSAEEYSLGEQIQYTDLWAEDGYLQFMYERLSLLRELLTDTGSIYVHLDWRRAHFVRLLMDEVFGADHCANEIAWCYTAPGNFTKWLPRRHDTILYYTKSVPEQGLHTFNRDDIRVPTTQHSQGAAGWADQWDPAEQAEAGKVPEDWWSDISPVGRIRSELTGYPTQKPEKLLERIIRTSSRPGDIVLDAFSGSGTSLVVSQRLGRRWIGCDINRGAIQTAARRIAGLMDEQVAKREPVIEKEPAPAQLAFSTWRVNDYDLQIQHNEAVNLACEFIGIERLRSDGFFDGTLGKSLAKVVPFNHPLTPLDLEEVKRELEARPDEERPVTLVCLGIEIGAQALIEDWNRMRRGKNAVNRIEVIELRTDTRYGGVIRHEPARAKVKVRRAKNRLHIEIEDFVSPTIIQRLQAQANVLQPQIEDWRAMVDSVSIDPSYDGSILNIAIADVPERKSDLVSGTYDLEAPAGETTVAVKIIDMLGEEVLVTERV